MVHSYFKEEKKTKEKERRNKRREDSKRREEKRREEKRRLNEKRRREEKTQREEKTESHTCHTTPVNTFECEFLSLVSAFICIFVSDFLTHTHTQHTYSNMEVYQTINDRIYDDES